MKYIDIQDKLPQWLRELTEEIHKYVPKFKKRVKNAYTEGLDFDSIKTSIMIYMLESTLDKFDHNQYPDVFNCVTRVIELYRTNEQDMGKWEEAWRAAEAAGAVEAEDAVRAAYYAAGAATYAAGAAAGAAEETAWAAWAAAWAAVGGVYRAYRSFGDKLIELINENH